MKFADWVWCKWNHVCIVHMQEKIFCYGPAGKGWYACSLCHEEYREKQQSKYKILRIKRISDDSR